MAKPTLADRITSAIQENNTAENKIVRGPILTPARTYLSPTDSYEDEIGQVPEMFGHAPGAMRGMWSVADQQQASVPVTNLTSSGNTNSNSLAAIQGGIAKNPVAPATTWAAVPQMITNLRVTGPVQIMASASVQSSVASDTVGFAIYRDGKLIGNHLTHTLPAATGSASMVQLSAMDNPPSGLHVYALYWSPGTGTLVATSNQRNLYAINLTPQG
jgi:hypothetical protein